MRNNSHKGRQIFTYPHKHVCNTHVIFDSVLKPLTVACKPVISVASSFPPFTPTSLVLSNSLSSSTPICLGFVYLFLFTFPFTHLSSNLSQYIVSSHSSFSCLLFFVCFETTLLSFLFFISSVCLCVSFILIVIVSVRLRVPETHYENVNLQKEQKGRAELIIPRYHELVPKQEEKKASMCLCLRVFVSMWSYNLYARFV